MSTHAEQLLVLGAGRGQVGLIRAARDRGLHVLVATLPSSSAPGIAHASEVIEVDVSDPTAVASAVAGRGLSGVVTSCMDTAMAALGRIVDRHSLIGVSEVAARQGADKLEMKNSLVAAGVPTAAFRELRSEDDLRVALGELGLPIVIKAVDLQGSEGVTIARTEEAARDGFRTALSLTQRQSVIAEEYIEGVEFGAQALVYRGEVKFVLPHGDEVISSATAIPVGHYVPTYGPIPSPGHASEVTKKAIRALGLDNCAVNLDFIARDGEIFVIELTGRAGANGLPEMVSRHLGVNYYDIIVGLALGEDPSGALAVTDQSALRAVAVRMLMPPPERGYIKTIDVSPSLRPDSAEYTFFRSVGDSVAGFTSSADCIGQVVVDGTSIQEALSDLETAVAAVDISVQK